MKDVSDSRLGFEVEARADGTAARACRFKTLHNEVLTPLFMPVATFAALRNQPTPAVEDMGYPVLLANTYHLLLRPGTEVFRTLGGIHKFMNWPRSVLTDSGGFQIFSMSQSFKITEEGASFRSYVDGRGYLLSPELSIDTQKAIGSDIMMALDQCASSRSPLDVCREAVELTARWAERSLAARQDSPQSLFGIVQGGCFPALRKRSAAQITSLPFDGYAIGGLAVGEEEEERKDITALTAALLPPDRPRYLMGVGTPLDLLEAVHRGMDMFDCIIPTYVSQQGLAYTSQGRVELRRSVYKLSDRPLDENCACPTCRSYSRAYLHHLVKTKEFLGYSLIGRHNLAYYKQLMDNMRRHILDNSFLSFYNTHRELLSAPDGEHPKLPPSRPVRKKAYTLGDYEIVEGPGFNSIRQRSSGETMHSVSDPMVESRTLYFEQSGLRQAIQGQDQADFVIWDVGLGAGTNAMVTIMEAEKLLEADSTLRIRIFSFENDLDSLRLACKHTAHFPHVRHAGPGSLLRQGQWVSPDGRIEWVLLEGDFEERCSQAPAPRCIYYDMFSLNTNGPLWNYASFSRLFRLCAPAGTRLLTYSTSTQVRGALLAAGFYVGVGPGTGPKSETTTAFSTAAAARGFTLLGRDWLERFRRSGSKTAPDASPEEKQEIEDKVLNHAQFSGDEY